MACLIKNEINFLWLFSTWLTRDMIYISCEKIKTKPNLKESIGCVLLLREADEVGDFMDKGKPR